jgi:cyclopropane fatty-acyl-phospholipid synthase-like methyltransferase
MNSTDAQTALQQITQDPRVTQMICVASELGIAAMLRDGPRSCDELAAAVSAHPRALYRLLRALASRGVFAETEDRRFELTPLAAYIQAMPADALPTFSPPEHMEWRWKPWGELIYSVRTGKPAFEHVYGMSTFQYFGQNPEAAKGFGDLMDSVARSTAAQVLEVCDLAGVERLVDVGGGRGTLLAAILKAYPRMRGILLDLPSVIEGARDTIDREGVADRCELVPRDFTTEPVPFGDAHILSHVIHDWDDAQATAILKNCHQSLSAHGRLYVVEAVVPPGNEPSWSKTNDLDMLVLEGGLERTETEFRALYDGAGFRLTGIIRLAPRQSGKSVIEGVPIHR